MGFCESYADNEATLAWLDHWRMHARDQGRVRLISLLDAVRGEIVFEINLIHIEEIARSLTDGKSVDCIFDDPDQ